MNRMDNAAVYIMKLLGSYGNSQILNTALICGIIFGSLVSIFAAIALIKGLNPFAQKGLPVCPFCVLGMIISLAIVFFSFREVLR